MPSAARLEMVPIWRWKKFTNCVTTMDPGWILRAQLSKDATERLKRRNNANKQGNSRLKVTTEFSFPRLLATYAQTRTVSRIGRLCDCFSPWWERKNGESKAHVVSIALAAQVTRKAEKVASWLTRLARKLRDGFKKHDSHQTVSCFLAPSGSSFSCPSCPGKVQLFSLGFWWDL